MEYRVEELATAGGVTVDTVRFYQGRGLLPLPEKRGRVAIYGDGHLARLRRIRELLGDGFKLAQIERLLSEPTSEPGSVSAAPEPLLAALAEEGLGARTFSRAELATQAGLPEPILTALQSAGLVEPILLEGQERFTAADVEMCRAGMGLLGAGFPLDQLLTLAAEHAHNVQQIAERSIDLFDDHVRKGPSPDDHAISKAFETLLPAVTRLVALHFQRTVINRAMSRLRTSGDAEALEEALAATESSHLEVAWK